MNSPSTKTSDGKTYDRLSEDDNESNATLLGDKSQGWKSFSESHSRGGCCRRSLVRVFSGLVIFSSVVALIFISTKVHHIEENLIHGVNLGDCGKLSTVEEARALGCIFDPMSWVWVRPECYDAELVADFMNRTDWSWHTDPKLTPESVVPMDEIYRGDHPKLFISKMYHTVHCAYMLKKLQKALTMRRAIDSYVLEDFHTMHCSMVMMDPYFHEDVQCTPEMVCPTWVRATWTACIQV